MAGQQQIGKADNGGQHIVEIMGNAAGKLADRLHFLALRELRLQRPLLGGLHGMDYGHLVLAVALQNRTDEDTGAALRFVGKGDVDGGGNVVLAGGRRIDGRRQRRLVARLRHVDKPPRLAVLAAGTEQHGETGIGDAQPALTIDGGNRHRRVVEEPAEPQLRKPPGFRIGAGRTA